MWKIISVFLLGLGAFLLPQQKKQVVAQAPVDLPTVNEGQKIGYLFGTLDSKAYIVDWFGQVNYQPVYAKGQGKK